MDRSSRQKTHKERRALNDTQDQMDFTDIFRAFHPKATEYTFFLCAHRTSSRIDHILITGITPCTFSDHNALKLELNHNRKVGKNSNTWRLKSILLKNEWVNQEMKKFMERNENDNTTVQNFGTQQRWS